MTIWSGIDTQNNPGTAAVKADCVGQGTSCPQYQQGLSSQLRTNVLIAATGGVAAGHRRRGNLLHAVVPPDDSCGRAAAQAGLHVTPLLGPGGAALLGTF